MVKSADNARLDRQIALVIAAVAAGLFMRGIAFDLLPGDAGEFQFASWRWGLAHPTGYPLYLLLGGVWQHGLALLGVAPAAALNALSAVLAGAATGLLYYLMVGWLPGAPATRRLAAGLAAALLIANPTLRTQSAIAEVYALHILLVVAILLAACRVANPPADRTQSRSSCALVLLSFLMGLSLAHHATTLLLILPLVLFLWLSDRNWWRPGRAWLWAAPALVLPLLLYLYVPLRSGAAASPWYHQRLGDGVLTLYSGTWPAFLAFVSGQSISAGFFTLAGALANAPTALVLWLRHFEWPGLVLMIVGIYTLVRMRAWPLLALTASYVAIHGLFNLFYAIGDIFVYYIPLYLAGCLWIGFGAAGIGARFRRLSAPLTAAPGATAHEQDVAQPSADWALVLVVLLYWLPLQLWLRYTPLVAQVAAESTATRTGWEAILAARPPAGAILVSNDRNEIVPLFYLQAVEGRAMGHTGLFPQIAPEPRFADLGATVQTALEAGGDQPVYLIKPMPGLEARFALAPRNAPLVEVLGPAAQARPAVRVDQAYGPLRLAGYDWNEGPASVQVDLHWLVDAPPAADYTTTVQLFDVDGNKLGQDDRRPGGDYYPTTLWKPGEMLVDRHTIDLLPGALPARLLVAMYSGPEATPIAPPLELPVSSE